MFALFRGIIENYSGFDFFIG
ncbi:unnamed protein product, partial [Didymodactylos carnosus]